MGAYIEIHYNCRGDFGSSYCAGTIRLYEAEFPAWLAELTKANGPVLITEITQLNGKLGQLAKAN